MRAPVSAARSHERGRRHRAVLRLALVDALGIPVADQLVSRAQGGSKFHLHPEDYVIKKTKEDEGGQSHVSCKPGFMPLEVRH